MVEPFSLTVTLQNSKGLHARAAAKFVKVSERFQAEIFVNKDGCSVSALSIMGLMMLVASCGTSITIQAIGPQAVESLKALEDLINNKFGEEV